MIHLKEINRLISKGISNIYYWGKLTFSKLRFSRKEKLKKCTSSEEQKGTRYIRENVYFVMMIFSFLSPTKLFLRFLLTYFASEIEGFYQSSLENEVHFMDVTLWKAFLTLWVDYRKIVHKNKLCHSKQ